MNAQHTHAERLEMVERAHSHLHLARALLARAGAAKTADRTRAAIRSCDGAIRNRLRFTLRDQPPVINSNAEPA